MSLQGIPEDVLRDVGLEQDGPRYDVTTIFFKRHRAGVPDERPAEAGRQAGRRVSGRHRLSTRRHRSLCPRRFGFGHW